MLILDPEFKGPIDRALLRYFADWMRAKKAYLKHVQRILPGSEHCRRVRETRVLEAEIRTLRACIRQVHELRALRKRKKGRIPEDAA